MMDLQLVVEVLLLVAKYPNLSDESIQYRLDLEFTHLATAISPAESTHVI